MNATYVNGTAGTAFATKMKLTPKMLSDWVEQATNPSKKVTLTYKDLNKSGLTGGEIAAIVIGSFIGAVMIIIAFIFLVRWCTVGMRVPTAAPKMMM